ncbi:MAG: hypothetical protein V2A66_02080 [Pseudomonadota bacterium]
MKKPILFIILAFLLLAAAPLCAEEAGAIEERPVAATGDGTNSRPAMWSVEVKSGFWLPSNAVMKRFFNNCCNIITRIEGGALIHGRYGIEEGVGIFFKSADAMGLVSGRQSQDSFSFLMIPMETNFVWRADYFTWRYIVPYVRAGVDYVYFREGDKGKTIQGLKWGLHGGGGVGVDLGWIGDAGHTLGTDYSIKGMFLTLEGRYQWINNFGSRGLSLSGGVYSAGLLFEF